MPRIAGVDIPNDKRVLIALQYIYGVGQRTSKMILKEAGIDESLRAKDLSEAEVANIAGIIDMERIASLGEQLGVPGLEDLPPKSEVDARKKDEKDA